MTQTTPLTSQQAERCALVLAAGLAPGLACNGAALLALTTGQRYPHLVGGAFVDARQHTTAGLCPLGIPVLSAPADTLQLTWSQAGEHCVDAVVLPEFAQKTTRYEALREHLSARPRAQWSLTGLALVGPTRAVRRLTREFGLWGQA